jgi:hypothetical protein
LWYKNKELKSREEGSHHARKRVDERKERESSEILYFCCVSAIVCTRTATISYIYIQQKPILIKTEKPRFQRTRRERKRAFTYLKKKRDVK